MKNLIVIVAVIIALFCLAGRFDYEDAKNQEALYCENVESGAWPDYKNIYKDVCKPKKFKKFVIEA